MAEKKVEKEPSRVSVRSITPFLWFNGDGDKAVKLYTSTFKGSKIESITPNGPEGPGKPGTPFVIEFDLAGQPFTALNLQSGFHFTEAFSMQVACSNQAQVDQLWRRLSRGGTPGRCGWLKDRFGLSWQIVPTRLGELMTDPDPRKVRRVSDALMKMGKIDIVRLEKAARGPAPRPKSKPR